MALNRWRRRFDGNERVDLPDFRTMMDRAFADFQLLIKSFIDNQSSGRVLRRYIQSTHATNLFKLKRDFNRALVDQGQEWLYVNTDAALTTIDLPVLNNVINYVEVRILISNDDLQTRAFWDTDIGLTGEEFFDQINVRTRLDEDFSVNQSGFSGGQWIPLFEVTVDGSGNITNVDESDDAFWKPRAFSLPIAANRPTVYAQDVQDLRSFIDFLAALMSEVKGTGQALESAPWSSIKLLREYQNVFFNSPKGIIGWETGGPNTLSWSKDILVGIAGRATEFALPSGAQVLQEEECIYVDIPETFTPGVNEVQQIALSAPAVSGDVILDIGGQLTASIPWNATVQQIEDAINALSSLEGGVQVTGTFDSVGPVVLNFNGPDGETNQPQVIINTNNLLVVLTPSTTTPGSAAVGASLTPVVSLLKDVPINPTAVGHSPRISVLFYRRGNKIHGSMEIPELRSGETAQIGETIPVSLRARLGVLSDSEYEAYSAAAIASGVIGAGDSYPAAISKLATRTNLNKVDYIDLGVTTSGPPTGAPFSVDGSLVVDGDDVLFTHSALNKVYRATVVAGNVTAWTAQTVFNGATFPTDGDEVSITSGTDYLQMVFRFNTTLGWKPLNTSQLEHEPTGYVDRDESEISFVEGTRTFTIQPKSPAVKFDYVTLGKIYRKQTAQSVVIPNVTGLYFIYFNGETLTQSSSFSYDIIKKFAFTASVYWDAVNAKATIFGDERHGLVLDGATHRYLHSTVGTRWVSGLSLGNFTTGGTGNAAADAQASLSDGVMYDEDLDLTPTNAAVPADPFEQILDPIAELPVLYRNGASGDWVKEAATQYPLLHTGGFTKYNDPAGPWTQVQVPDGQFVAMWVFGTNDIRHPIVAILGQRVDTTLSDAQANNTYESLQFGNIPSLEMKVLFRLVYEVNTAFTNAVDAALRDVRDLRQAIDTSIAAFSSTDHGGLTGLNDPDHGPTAVTTTGVTKDGGLSASDVDVKQSLDTLNKLFGQLRLKPHASVPERAVITGAERVLNSTTTLIQTLKSLVLDFDGAQIDFETGSIYKADGTTPLGINFTPFAIPATQFFFYSVHVVASVVNANNTITAQVLVLPATGAAALLANAPRPAFARGATPLGTVYVQESGGGIAAITAANIGQLGTGVGSGSGSVGPGQLFIEELRRRLEDEGLMLNWLTPNVPEVHEDDRIHGSSTGSFDIANGEYDFTAPTQFLLSTQNYGSQFLANEQENLQIELHALWTDGFVDDAATYQVSKDGGTTLETVTMERVGESNKFRGVHVFAEPPGSIQYEYDVSNANTTSELNATSVQAYALKLAPLALGTKKKILTGNIYVNKLGTPTGDLIVKLVKETAGVPGTTVVGYNLAAINIATLVAGNNTVAIEIPAILVEGTYWLVFETSAGYKASFVAATHAIRMRVDNTAPTYPQGDSYRYNGTTWLVETSTQTVFQLSGYTYDLRVKIIASQSSSLLGFGIFYGEQNPLTYDEHQAIERIDVDGDADETEFTLTKFIPDPLALKVYDVNTGQVYRFPSFAVDGRKVVFATGTFLAPGETITLLFDQAEAQVFDNSDANANLLASNRLGSTDPTISRAVAGEGLLHKADTGQMVEASIFWNGSSYEWIFAEVP